MQPQEASQPRAATPEEPFKNSGLIGPRRRRRACRGATAATECCRLPASPVASPSPKPLRFKGLRGSRRSAFAWHRSCSALTASDLEMVGPDVGGRARSVRPASPRESSPKALSPRTAPRLSIVSGKPDRESPRPEVPARGLCLFALALLVGLRLGLVAASAAGALPVGGPGPGRLVLLLGTPRGARLAAASTRTS